MYLPKDYSNIRTLGDLKRSGYTVRSVKEEMRDNLITKISEKRTIFPGIIGFEETVIPQIVNALLSMHDFIFLGLRGQAKSRMLRGLIDFLDEYIPIVEGSEVNDNPFAPVSKHARDLLMEHGEEMPIEWVDRDRRYAEKLATPDVTIADLIGDIDPIKAASQRLHYAHEGTIHFGIIPRTNRGIFAINEIPDLQQRIQVGLLNIMQEKDIQIRGFPVRIPLDILIVYSANPEDYTNRGNIITPLRDRIASQIHTHYPSSIDDGIRITDQEAWTARGNGSMPEIPHYFREIIEQIAVEARRSEYVDQKSGVSQRLPITCFENLLSNIERRRILFGDSDNGPRISDLDAVIPSIVGKIELVYEGEQEGVLNVAKLLVGKAVKEVFMNYFPQVFARKANQETKNAAYDSIKQFFAAGNKIEVGDDISTGDYFKTLDRIEGLRDLAVKYLGMASPSDGQIAAGMEFVLEGLHQHSVLSKDVSYNRKTFSDYVDNIFSKLSDGIEDDYSDEFDDFR